jgi:hypothetical protein
MVSFDSLDKKEWSILVGIMMVGIVLVGLFVVVPFQLGAYGVPSETVQNIVDSSGTYNGPGGYGSAYTWSYKSGTTCNQQTDSNAVTGSEAVTVCLDYNLQITLQVTAPAGPTNITNQTAIFKLTQQNSTAVTYFKQIVWGVWSYSFKFSTIWNAPTLNFRETQRTAQCFYCKSLDSLGQTAIQNDINTFNSVAIETAADIVWGINAPALLGGALFPGYLGIMGIFLQSYNLAGVIPGAQADLVPQLVGNPSTIYLQPGPPPSQSAWSGLGVPTPTGYQPTVQQEYYPQDFFTPYGYIKTHINGMGSTIAYQCAQKQYPNCWVWAYQAQSLTNAPSTGPNCYLPCVDQWFRIDVVEQTTTPFQIPNYNLPTDQRSKQSITVPSEPQNLGTNQGPATSALQQLNNFINALFGALFWIAIGGIVILALVFGLYFIRKLP